MNRLEWRTSQYSIRALLHRFKEQGADSGVDRICEYKFGLVWNPRFGFHHIWNGIAKNTMATIRLTEDNVILRYRDNSFYKHEIAKFSLEGYKTVLVKSKNLSRHRDWVHHRIQTRVRDSIQVTRDTMARAEGQQNGTFALLQVMMMGGEAHFAINHIVRNNVETFNVRVILDIGEPVQQTGEMIIELLKGRVLAGRDVSALQSVVKNLHDNMIRSQQQQTTQATLNRILAQQQGMYASAPVFESANSVWVNATSTATSIDLQQAAVEMAAEINDTTTRRAIRNGAEHYSERVREAMVNRPGVEIRYDDVPF